jgi:hypothetical protein
MLPFYCCFSTICAFAIEIFSKVLKPPWGHLIVRIGPAMMAKKIAAPQVTLLVPELAQGGSLSGTTLDLSYLEATIGYSIRRAQLAVFQDIYCAFGSLSVTTAQFSVLAVVADNP